MPFPVMIDSSFSLNWGAVGVIGGAVYTTYQVLTNNLIQRAILELKLTIQDRFAKIEERVSVNYEKHLSLMESVRDLQMQIIQLQKDIAYRDGMHSSGVVPTLESRLVVGPHPGANGD